MAQLEYKDYLVSINTKWFYLDCMVLHVALSLGHRPQVANWPVVEVLLSTLLLIATYACYTRATACFDHQNASNSLIMSNRRKYQVETDMILSNILSDILSKTHQAVSAQGVRAGPGRHSASTSPQKYRHMKTRLHAHTVVANPRHSRAMSAVCASV